MSAKRFLNTRFAFLIVFLFSVIFTVPQAVYAQDDQADQDSIKEVIQQYFELRYAAGKSLEPADLSAATVPSKFDPQTANWLREEKDQEDIEQTIAKLYNTSYLQYKYSLDYQSFDIHGAEAKVRLFESNEVVYTNHPDITSKMGDVEHQIILRKVDSQWRIVIDRYQNDMKRLMASSTKDQIFKNIQTNYDSQFIERSSTDESGQTIVPLYTTYSVNRTAIKNYADANYNKTTLNYLSSDLKNSQPGWNPSWYDKWLFHSSNDCANFASQSVFTGTSYVHADTNTFSPSTSDQSSWWYHFSPIVQDSAGWSSVSGLHDYLINNTGRGPYGLDKSTDYCQLAVGDLVMMQSGSTWTHTVIVSAITGDCTSPANILVDAHTDPWLQKPLSYWSSYTLHAIHLSGYRK